ncbi:hypothetical protein AAFF_G00276330 [Aldrovandia affinis]|uniref:Uncharacterized protein n=1 Tax=Aldrovandia affinis TaxID=143900 RepID=A0AAD7W266_9TELE|nr:hypothetical protein AAFF_G00276330 [Aldrovandia affinis]
MTPSLHCQHGLIELKRRSAIVMRRRMPGLFLMAALRDGSAACTRMRGQTRRWGPSAERRPDSQLARVGWANGNTAESREAKSTARRTPPDTLNFPIDAEASQSRKQARVLKGSAVWGRARLEKRWQETCLSKGRKEVTD